MSAEAGESILAAATTSRVEIAGRHARDRLATWVGSAGYLAPDPALVSALVAWVDELVAKRERVTVLKEALDDIAGQQQETLEMIKRNGFVFATELGKPDDQRSPAERWEKLAFTLYGDICEIDSKARLALAMGEEA